MQQLLSGARRRALALGAAAVSVSTLAVGFAQPAFADPATTFVAVGSDTTQDVIGAIGAARGQGVFGSWDAYNIAETAAFPGNGAIAHEDITPKIGCSMTRPNGSGEGVSALRKSLSSGTAATQLTDAPEQGCVDIARSSSGPGSNQTNTGALQYIPFALDAVAPVTGSSTSIADADGFTVANLQSLYQCNAVTVNGTTYTPDNNIHLYIPQAGSGTRSFWASQMGINATTPPSCVHDHAWNGSSFGGALVEEHDGTVYSGDAMGFGPFSIAQWISQRNGHNDRRHGAILHSLNGIAPTTGSNGAGSLNVNYPITREVYDVVLHDAVTSGTSSYNAALAGLVSGGSSFICQQGFTISQYGFGSLSSAPLGHTCGQVTDSLRAFATI